MAAASNFQLRGVSRCFPITINEQQKLAGGESEYLPRLAKGRVRPAGGQGQQNSVLNREFTRINANLCLGSTKNSEPDLVRILNPIPILLMNMNKNMSRNKISRRLLH